MNRPTGEGLLLAMALLWPTLIAWLYFVGLANPETAFDGPNNPAAQAVYTLGKVVQFGVPAVWLWWTAPEGTLAGWFRWPGIIMGGLFGIFVLAGMLLLYSLAIHTSPILAEAPAKLRGKLAELGCATPMRFLLLAVFLSGVHSLLEEFYYRGFIYAGLRHYFSAPVATILASAGFMSHHVIILWVYFPNTFWLAVVPASLGIAIGGVMWAILYERTKSLMGPWLSHALADIGLMIVGYQMVFG